MKRRRPTKIHSKVVYSAGDVAHSALDEDGTHHDLPPPTKQLKSISANNKERDRLLGERTEALTGMPSSSRAALNMIVTENGAAPDDPHLPTYAEVFDEREWIDIDDDAPDLSHEGGEHTDATRAAQIHILDGIPTEQRRAATRTRRERLEGLQRAWTTQMPSLVEAYIQWKHRDTFKSTSASPSESSSNTPSDSPPHDPLESATPTATPPSATARGTTSTFTICAVYTHSFEQSLVVHQEDDELANVALLRRGLLGCSPISPEYAVSLRTLDLYHRLRRHHAQLGFQALARALCDVHGINYSTTVRDHLSAVFDVYLDILRRVQARVEDALGHTGEAWRMRNKCPCCTLALEGRPPLVPARLFAIDGNNSAKRVASAGLADNRYFQSSYFLSRAEVDRFKDEVKYRAIPQKVKEASSESDASSDEEDAPWVGDGRPGEAPDGEESLSPCADRWKASAAEHTKRALNIYDTTGMFVCACRHGLIQIACEMWLSGELAKYGLSIVDRVIDVHGADTGMGYDIGCSFKKTVTTSKLVGPKAAAARTQFAVCAFHGYAHNRLCQLSHHPLYLSGYGIEDLEGMERVFSLSNTVARLVRYASRFHWLQYLDLHFQQWDDDRYADLSRFLYNNYKQCLSIISDYTLEINRLKSELSITDSIIEGWLDEERRFLLELKAPPDERALEIAYVQALIQREQADQQLASIRTRDWVSTSSVRDVDYAADARQTLRLEAARRAAFDKVALAIQAVGDLEQKLVISPPWTPAHPKYRETLSYMRHQEFHNALDKVQQLVMQRLLELSKANMTGMGYKLRTHIGKALKTRGKAIRSALKRYNALAPRMYPPAPVLQWKDVVSYAFVSEFDLLRHSYGQRDITSAPWVKQRNREVTSMYFKVKRAREELGRLHEESQRLYTSIVVERAEFEAAIRTTEIAHPALAAELAAQLRTRIRLHDTHRTRLSAIHNLPGYSGPRTPGIPTHRGREVLLAANASNAAAPYDGSNTIENVADSIDTLTDRALGFDPDSLLYDEQLHEDMVFMTESLEDMHT